MISSQDLSIPSSTVSSSPSLQQKQPNLTSVFRNSAHKKIRLPTNLLKKDDQEMKKFFHMLDIDKDGVLSRDDLEMSLKKMRLPQGNLSVESILEKCGSKTGTITYELFSDYLGRQNEHLKRVIAQLDANKYDVEVKTEITISVKEKEGATSQLEKGKEETEAPVFMVIKWEHLLLAPEPTWDGFSQYLGSNVLRDLVADLESSNHSKSLNYLLAGGLAGAVSRTSTAPLDRLKILLQIQRSGVREFCGVMSGLTYIYRDGGITSFFRGNGTNILKIVPESAIKFYTYEHCKKFLSKDDTSLSLPRRFLAGAVAGLTSQIFIYPLECVKTRLAISPPGTYSGIWNCIVQMSHQEGIKSLYRGLKPALIGVVPYAGIDLTIYETLKTLFSKPPSSLSPQHKNQTQIGVLPLLACGIISSSIGQLASYPLALARTRLQAQGLPNHPVIYAGMKDVIVKTARNEGITGLYKGLIPNFLKVAPAVSISYAVYESTKTFLS